MRRRIFEILVLVAAILVISCFPPSEKQSPAGKAADKSSGKLVSTEGMTAALLEIEAAMAGGQIDPLLARYEKDYKTDPRDPFSRFLWAFSLGDRNEAWAELTKITATLAGRAG